MDSVSLERLELAERVRVSEWVWADRLIGEAADLLGETLPARLASDYAARTPQTEAGAAAIAAARAWAADAADAADAAAWAAADAAAAAWAAASWAYDADAADAAAWAAAYAAYAASPAASSRVAASRAATFGADAAADADGEKHWQRERLALYLGSPIWPNPVEVTRG